MRLTRLLAFALALPVMACPWGDDDDEPEVVPADYQIDQVPVVLDNGNGPDEATMTVAVEIYRAAALERFLLESTAETEVWRKLAEIRFADELVPPVGGTYDADTGKMLLEYHGCIIDTRLYELLAAHYHYALNGVESDEHETWAHDLAADNTILCAR